MKQMLLIALVLILATTGCKKGNCVQCARQVPIPGASTPLYTVDSIVQVQYCGLYADSAMSPSAVIYPAFVAEHALQAYSCFYTNQ